MKKGTNKVLYFIRRKSILTKLLATTPKPLHNINKSSPFSTLKNYLIIQFVNKTIICKFKKKK